MSNRVSSLGVAALLLLSVAEAAAPANFVPWPQSVQLSGGTMTLSARSRIVSQDPQFDRLAKILAEEIQRVAGLKLAIVQGTPAPGDIVLTLDPKLKGEAYRLEVTDRATVGGRNYGAVALGTVTLLEVISVRGQAATVAGLVIDDRPQCEYRGLLVDVARRFHSIASLKQIVTLCRLYKVRYLQLHLTDDQAFTFPSRAYPVLNAKSWHGGRSYTLDELHDLVAFADARNVTIIPEYEMPGHSAAANRALHDLFIIAKTKPYEHHASINFCKPEVMRAVETIVGEMCAVFKSSPYFHIGGDEADLALADQNAEFKAAMKELGLPNQHELYRRFLCQMNEIVKKQGKQMIVWEGFGRHGKVAIPKDVLVMPYEFRFYMPQDLVDDGYTIVNASWTPLYVVNDKCRPPAEIYAWNHLQFKPYGAKPDDKGAVLRPAQNVLGAQMCAWEQPEARELPSLRPRLPAMMERIWNPSAGKTFDDFNHRMAVTDRLLDLLLDNGRPEEKNCICSRR